MSNSQDLRCHARASAGNNGIKSAVDPADLLILGLAHVKAKEDHTASRQSSATHNVSTGVGGHFSRALLVYTNRLTPSRVCINSESCSVSCFYPKKIPRCRRSATNQTDHCQRNSTRTLHRGLWQQRLGGLGGGVTVSEQHSAHSLQRGACD